MQPDVPTRHLTFLFADVERSTRLTELHGAAAGAALARYHELVERAAAAHGGHVFERVGDGAYAVFDAARDAVAAAVELQVAVQAEPWGAVGRIRIRVALVTGDVEQRGDRYYGRPLFRAARIQGFAEGGETLIAGTTFDDLGGWVPDGMRLRDLGTQRLRDIPQPERIYALVLPGRARTPTPRAADGTRPGDQPPIRVLLVDDHAVVRRGLRGFLELLKDFEVVGEAENGREALAAVERLAPDVVLMDLLMPEMTGIEAITALRSSHPGMPVVALTSFVEEDKIRAALAAGAAGYLLKDAEAEEVASAIRAAHGGGVPLDPAVARVLADQLRGEPGAG